MTYSTYEVLESGSVDDLNTQVAAAIAAGKQPVGPPVTGRLRPQFMQAVATGDVGAQIETAVITVTTAELLALNATPKTLIAAPGAGIAIIPMSASLFLDYNSAAYAGIAAGEDLTFKYTNGSGNTTGTVEATGFLDQTADQHREYAFTGEITPTANAALVLHMSTGEIITGNSPLKIVVRYRLLTLLT